MILILQNFVMVKQLAYHSECLKCVKCQAPLTAATTDIILLKAYCLSHKGKDVPSNVTCPICKKKFVDVSKEVLDMVEGIGYHNKPCFACTDCKSAPPVSSIFSIMKWYRSTLMNC